METGDKQYYFVVILDIEHTFNFVKCESTILVPIQIPIQVSILSRLSIGTMKALDRIGIPKYLYNLVARYFTDRVFRYHNEKNLEEYSVRGVVPQGSVLGPLLWNIM